MKKTGAMVAAMIIAGVVLGGLYAVQPGRMTPARVKLAMAAEEGLQEIQAVAASQQDSEDAAEEAAANDKNDSAAKESAVPQEVPDVFRVKFECSNGSFIAEFKKEWSEAGAQRVHELVTAGFYDGARFFRVLKSPRPFMAQFGIAGDPKIHAEWSEDGLVSEEVKQSNTRGKISFAMAGSAPKPNWTNKTRTTQLFINYGDNSNLDSYGFAPVGEVVEGMDVVDALYGDYGEGAPQGNGPDQGAMRQYGNAYLEENFPNLDFIKSTTFVDENGDPVK